MTLPTIACGPLPEVVDLRISSKNISGQEVYSVVQGSALWPNNSVSQYPGERLSILIQHPRLSQTVTVSFLDGTPAQQNTVESAFTQYTIYANIKFVFVEDQSNSANIRITFASPKAWSAIGRNALSLSDQPTMNLGSINQDNPSEVDRAIVLHEVGHALGMEHEWDGQNTQLVNSGNDDALAQHIERCAGKVVSNFPQVDTKSVMNYFLPAQATSDGKGVPVNSELSDADKAWLVINYPGRSATLNGVRWSLLQAIDVLKISPGVASRILSGKVVSDKRSQYAKLIANTWGSQIPISAEKQSSISRELGSFDSRLFQKQPSLKANFSTADEPSEGDQNTDTVDPVDPDTIGMLAAVVLHPSFRETVTKIAENDLVQRGYNLAQYPIQNSAATGAQQGILSVLAPILTQVAGSLISGLVSQNGIQANPAVGYYPGQPLPPEVQQGVFDMFADFVQNPIFTNIVKNIVNGTD
ncbi:hypothetical protein Moror_3307 [Moniliophthora roreri MCA 2997]|uniref:Peptidase metallopeptidase domain-containing protein n=1 Tax=Moniliophthora roreri (strain MCA 2997) TaxID=1381753 RepID=V2W8R0_MONRO|nr:hypothetical protein Moror_3307 [Moniliophthora roreri MCA 2997]